MQPEGPGAYDVQWGTDTIRVLVLREMPDAEQNIVWNLFSGDAARVAAALDRIRPRLQSWSSTLNELLSFYGLEGMAMPYTMEDFERDVAEKVLKKLTIEQRVQGLSPEQLLSRLPFEEIERYVNAHKSAHEKDARTPPGDASGSGQSVES